MKQFWRILCVVAATIAGFGGNSRAATMSDYCVTPPFIQQSGNPNLLLMIDNSASMYDLQYQDTSHTYCANSPTTPCTSASDCSGIQGVCKTTTITTSYCYVDACTNDSQCPSGHCSTKGYCQQCNEKTCTGADCKSSTGISPKACSSSSDCATGDTCNNQNACNLNRQCYDSTFSTSKTYSGYFDTAATYSYDFSNNKFTSGATMPGSCSYPAGSPTHVCITTFSSGSSEALTGFVASGNFLNWLTTSKFDVEKKILTGGKYDAPNSVLISESRGCGSGDFIKAIPGLGVTFGVRGGTPGGVSSAQSLANEYGQTYIDVFSGAYNTNDCLAAMNDWSNITGSNPPSLASLQNDTKGCIGTSSPIATDANVTASSFWNHVLHDCYQGFTNGGQSWSTNLNALEGECQKIYDSGMLPSAMTDAKAAYAVCSSVLHYNDKNGVTQTGYLGSCWNGTNFSSCPSGGLTDVQQMENYCQVNVNSNPVVDPSGTSTTSINSQDITGLILKLGLLNMTPVGTLTAKVSLTPQPNGLINDPRLNFKDTIRFGVMTFQNNGSGTECGSSGAMPCAKACSTTTTRLCYLDSDCPSGESCSTLAKTDGGRIVSYIGASSSVGDHTTGLIKQIDDIQATSWTPFAEAFYNAIGYFARTNTYSDSPATSRSDSNFNLLPSPNTEASYDTQKNPSQIKCQNNNILLITDGMSTADRNSASEGLASLYASVVPNVIGGTTYYGVSGYDTANSCPANAGSRSISDLAWIANNRNIKSLTTSGTASTTTPAQESERIKTYVVYSGPQTSGQPGLCDPKTLMENTAQNGGTNLYQASDPDSLKNQLQSAFTSVAAKTASGTAASILSNSEGSGALLLQALFYPRKYFDNGTSASWIGEMHNLWYFVDPFIGRSSVREDTTYTSGSDHYLDLKYSYVTSFVFNGQQTNVYLSQDTNADGAPDTAVSGDPRVISTTGTASLISPDDIKSLWRAGRGLWKRDISSNPRNIYTYLKGTSALNRSGTTVTFTKDCLVNLVKVAGTDGNGICYYNNLNNDEKDIIQYLLQAPTLADAEAIIAYAHGTDNVTLSTSNPVRSRKVQINSVDTTERVWKLGDIIHSTPRIESSSRINNYSLIPPAGYHDKTYGDDITQSGYIYSSAYQNRGMAFAGANDGMLHAFNLGQLSVLHTGNLRAKLTGTNLGEEKWAFIPRNALPYLKYLLDPLYSDKNHIYLVDGSTRLVDASVGVSGSGCSASTYYDCHKDSSTWKTILIGSMGIGGAARNGFDSSGNPISGGNWVNTPIKDVGRSSYFALDVTDPTAPQFLWEFSSDDLGYTTSDPAIVRINTYDNAGNAQTYTNGHWYAVFGNGPTGPISNFQFMGQSDNNLKIFVLDLVTGTELKTITTNPVITNAFAGRMGPSPIDVDRWAKLANGFYSDDALYFGYTNYDSTNSIWNGGVLRLMTKEAPDPNNWTLTKLVEGVGPVTASIAKIQDRKNHKLWLYFGGGRYFYRGDDQTAQRYLIGVKEPCYQANDTLQDINNCTSTIPFDPSALPLNSHFVDQTTSISSVDSKNGWYIQLDGHDTTSQLDAERVITDPTALSNGAVVFTSYKPSNDQCSFGGQSFLWATQYNTGGVASSAARNAQALVQVSTGEFKQVSLSSDLTGSLGRKMGTPMTGKPSIDSPPLVSGAGNKPYKRILHVQEK